MVKAWIADVTPLLDKECYDSYYRQVPDFRKKKADALRLDKMRAQSVGVWALWQKIRTTYDLPEESIFNFSHSGTCVMCAVCMDGREARVGCDVEKTGQLQIFLSNKMPRIISGNIHRIVHPFHSGMFIYTGALRSAKETERYIGGTKI